ncbi:GntR family transcriptional regulator [Paraburkholderia susongensis]|uniref:Transcriptional regulator, GntR family n=1 Tax=Paraburkholderia susongensis TaxID=1515439 RepID=A0A1X7LL33_9BURK|nr:GntR family transcriptional regulator [Paraburkholderia susongensis]SMG54053.1 transcriptional regulator, GntR family [Paraburkholderia susongensis]
MTDIAEPIDLHDLLGGPEQFDRSGPLPLWVQVKNVLEAAIRHPGVNPRARVPSEQNLCDLLGVSRPIVRLALDSLVKAGLITKVPRQGIYVAPRKTDVDFASMNESLFAEISRGHKVTTRVLQMERERPTQREREMLALPPGADVFRLYRLYSVDDVPTALSWLMLAGHRVPGIEALIADNVSAYGVMRERYDLRIEASERWFEAAVPNEEQAALLQLLIGQPVLSIESVGRTGDHQPLEYYRCLYSTAFSRIHVTAHTRAQPPASD